MIIKASERGGARSLARHLTNAHDNDHVELFEVRGVVGKSLHAALLEIDAVSQGTRTKAPFFSVSFNPPKGEKVTYEQFLDAFERVEKKHGLADQPRAVVFHEKEGRRHAHVVWSRIDVMEMKAIKTGLYKKKCSEISKSLYIEHGWDMPQGFINKQERDPFQLSNVEWQKYKRDNGVDPKEIKLLCQDAWKHSDNLNGFKYALEERNLFLAQGDKRGFVVLDHMGKVYSLPRYGGIKKKDLESRFGSPEQLPSVSKTQEKIKRLINGDILSRIDQLKRRHKLETLPLDEKKALLVHIQRAERRELSDQQRVKRGLVAKSGKERYRRGLRGFFDKVTGNEKRVRLVNRKETVKLKQKQTETRQMIIFRHNRDRSELQREIVKMRDSQRQERMLLAKRIHEFRQEHDQERKKSISREFERSHNDQKEGRSTDTDKVRLTRRGRRSKTKRLDI